MSSDNRNRKLVRQVEKETRSGKRDIARNKMELEREEKALVAEIKKYAQLGDKAMCSRLAQQLISLRKQIGRNVRMSAEISQIGTQARLGAAQHRLMTVAQETSKTMTAMNKQMDAKKMAQNMQAFQNASFQLNMKEELMDDFMNDFDANDVEAEDAVVNEVLSSLAIDVGNQLDKARVPTSSMKTESEKADFSDLEKQLEQLRR
ncbi:hypothetical protein FGIG_07489 [Fasciola gigantica]|uniref:Charged multivesicular body protein 2b n=1 Tax=Fasciola gigantica TaxID=46835 RepID=A0A504Y8B9_FASGI|nr:hypothetical protein FGIG_07489 [Fasciola gigantica]